MAKHTQRSACAAAHLHVVRDLNLLQLLQVARAQGLVLPSLLLQLRIEIPKPRSQSPASAETPGIGAHLLAKSVKLLCGAACLKIVPL